MKAADRDLRAMRRVLLDGAEDHGEPDLLLPSATLDGVRSLLGGASVSMGVIDSTKRIASPWQDLSANPGDGDTDMLAVFFRRYWDCVPCAYPDRTGDLARAVPFMRT